MNSRVGQKHIQDIDGSVRRTGRKRAKVNWPAGPGLVSRGGYSGSA